MSTDVFADDERASSAAVVADAVRRATLAETAVERDAGDPSLVITQVRADTTLKVEDLERYAPAPRRASGTAVLHNATDFAAYVQRVAGPYTTVWADETTLTVTAVINDHTAPSTTNDGTEPHEPGWRDHTVVLRLQPDPEWLAWAGASGLEKLMTPPKMAEHLENYDRNIVNPTAADMIELADTMRASRNADVVDSTDRRSGATHILYKDEVRASGGKNGELAIPDELTLSIAPYLGWDPVTVKARFRFRVAEERGDGATRHRLKLGYELVRPDLVQRDAFGAVRAVVQQRLGDSIPIFTGSAPAPRGSSVSSSR